MKDTLDLHLPRSPLAVSRRWTGERVSEVPMRGCCSNQSKGYRGPGLGQRSEMFGENHLDSQCLKVMIKGGATVAGDLRVPGLGDGMNDSAEMGWLGRRKWPVKSAGSIQEALSTPSWDRVIREVCGSLSGFEPGFPLVLPESAPGRRAVSYPSFTFPPVQICSEVNFFSISETQSG